MTVAAIGAAAIGVAGTVYASKKASSSAKQAARISSDADKARLDFEKERYAEWNATYGPLEDSLASYYQTLTPTLRAVQGLEAFEKEKNIALTNMRENLSQRGIATSGIAGQLEGQIAVGSAAERARIRAAAPLEVAKEKASFLATGMGQNPANQVGSALSDIQRNADSDRRIAAQNSGIATNAMIGSITDLAQTAWTTYQNRKQTGVWDEVIPANPRGDGT